MYFYLVTQYPMHGQVDMMCLVGKRPGDMVKRILLQAVKGVSVCVHVRVCMLIMNENSYFTR